MWQPLHTPPTYVFCKPSDYQSISVENRERGGGGPLAETVALATSSVKSVAQRRCKTQLTKPHSWKLADRWQDGVRTCLGPAKTTRVRVVWKILKLKIRAGGETDESLCLSQLLKYGTVWTVGVSQNNYSLFLKFLSVTFVCVLTCHEPGTVYCCAVMMTSSLKWRRSVVKQMFVFSWLAP